MYAGQQIRILGESYTLDDDEDSKVGQVGRLWIYEARYVEQCNILDMKRITTLNLSCIVIDEFCFPVYFSCINKQKS